MCSIIGVGERLHKVLGQIDFGTLDSGKRSLPFGLLVSIVTLLSYAMYIIAWLKLLVTKSVEMSEIFQRSNKLFINY